MDQDLLRLALLTMIACLCVFKLIYESLYPTPPKYDSELHKFTQYAKEIAQEYVQEALARNEGFRIQKYYVSMRKQ